MATQKSCKKGHIVKRCTVCENIGCQNMNCTETMKKSGGRCNKCGSTSSKHKTFKG